MADIPIQIVINGRDNSGPAFNSLGSSLARVGEIATGFITAQVFTRIASGFKDMAFAAIDTTKQLEQNRIGLKGILGSFEAADKTIARVKQEAKRTPFELPGLLEMTQLLATATKNGDRSVDLILSLGDAVSFVGKGQPELQRIISNMQQIQAVGKASLMDLRQFGFAGIPIFEMLSKETGKTGQALQDFISDGGVTFGMLEKMFNKSAKAGGQFFNAMQSQSTTLTGIQSNISDTIGIIGTEIVSQSGLFDMLKQGASGFLGFLEGNKDNIINFFKNVIKGFVQIKTVVGDVFTKIASAVGGSDLFGAIVKSFESIGKVISSISGPISDFVNTVLGALIESWKVIAPLITGVVTNAFDVFGQIILAIQPGIESFINIFKIIIPVILEVATAIIGFLAPIFDTLVNILGVILPPIFNGFMQALSGIAAVIGFVWSVAKPIIELFASMFQIAFGLILIAWQTVLKPALESIGQFIREKVIPVIKPIADFFVEAFNKAKKVVSDVFQSIKTGVIYPFMNEIDRALMKINEFLGRTNEAKAAQDRISSRNSETLKPVITRATAGVVSSAAAGIKGFANGGLVSDSSTNVIGGSSKDTVPAMLSEDEGVMTGAAINKFLRGEIGNNQTINVSVVVNGSVVSEGDLARVIVGEIRKMAKMEAKAPSEYLNFSGRP